jgi:thymidylate kinase
MNSDGAKIVSFSGIDGAGKTTQIDALLAYLQQRGLRTKLFTFWDNVVVLSHFRERVSLKAFRGDEGVGSPDNPIIRRDKNVTAWYVVAFRLVLYALDAFSLRIAVARSSSDPEADVVIFDRYIYDELANLPLNSAMMKFYIRMILHIVPAPHVAFLIDADPVAAASRKPEYPLEFVRKNRNAYLNLAQLAGNLTILPPASVSDTAERIKTVFVQNCLKDLEPTITTVGTEHAAEFPHA